jgi:hypothetical protein
MNIYTLDNLADPYISRVLTVKHLSALYNYVNIVPLRIVLWIKHWNML